MQNGWDDTANQNSRSAPVMREGLPTLPEKRFRLTVIDGVMPLAASTFPLPESFVPTPLAPFMQSEDSHLYAVLDGARVFGLRESLESASLDHCCLYEQDAGLDDVAPWLVSVQLDSPFCRSLFLDGDAPIALWSREPGIFLRSRMTLSQLRSKLRKFTRVTDETGRRRLLRFWDPRVIGRYAALHHPEAFPHITGLLSGLELLACDIRRGRALHVAGVPEHVHPQAGPWPYLAHDMEQVRRSIFREDLELRLIRRVPAVGALEDKIRKNMIIDLEARSHYLGLHADKSVERYCLASLMLGGPAEDDKCLQPIFLRPCHELDKSRILLETARATLS